MSHDCLIPPDNPVELHLTDLSDWWLQVACGCGRTTYFSLLFIASRQSTRTTLGNIMSRFRCQTCKSEPATLALVDNPAKGEKSRGGSPQVRVILRGE